MPLNVPGLLVPFQLLFYPRFVIPSLVVTDIRQVDFFALRRAGYRGAVFDKDNCLVLSFPPVCYAKDAELHSLKTIPHKDTLVPELQESWKSCREAFGEGNVLVVSNSAGTYLDAGGLQAESVSYHLGVPVLYHKSFKPAYSCIADIRSYFKSLPSPVHDHELVIVGDRIFTDIVLANRMRRQLLRDQAKRTSLPPTPLSDKPLSSDRTETPVLRGPLSIWTTGVWKKESMIMRWMETKLVSITERHSKVPAGESIDVKGFLRPISEPVPPKKPRSIIDYLVTKFRN